MSPLALVVLALVLDLALGDPDWPGHPVRLMGRFASFVESRLRPGAARPLAAGLVAWILVAGLSAAVAGGFLLLCRWLGSLAASGLAEAAKAQAAALKGKGAFGFWTWLAHLLALPAKPSLAAAAGAKVGTGLASVLLVYVAIAPRDLARHALAVARGLRDGGVESGRKAAGMLVGRDVDRLDEEGVVKACVESVAEGAVDGAAAPLFWALVLGPIGAIAYRAINTLDSMWGHRTPRHNLFGRVAARADDVANWLPARLAFLACWAGAALVGLDARRALAIGWRDRRRHESPNAAWLEAAFAGALGLGLGGPAWYGGERLERPTLGSARRPAGTADIQRSIALMYATTLVFAAALGPLASLLPWR